MERRREKVWTRFSDLISATASQTQILGEVRRKRSLRTKIHALAACLVHLIASVLAIERPRV